MDKIYIFSDTNSDWVSCKTIKSNLIESYKCCFPGSVEILEANSLRDPQNSEALKYILENEISRLIFIDHEPVPFKFILALSMIYDIKKIEFIFHVYGDFMFHIGLWQPLLNILKGSRVKLICASDAQRDLVLNLIQNEDTVFTCPFSVRALEFYPSEDLRNLGRNHFKMNDSCFNIVYTGRLSNQKNITMLMDMVKVLNEKFKIETKLYLAGSFDDLGVPYLGLKFIPLFYYEQIMQRLGDHCVYLGNLNKEQLNILYNSADLYCSLSVHNDEDFGMSPAEALVTGLPCLLTKWGGFKSFNINTEHVNVAIEDKQIKVDEKMCVKYLFKLSTLVHDEVLRKSHANEFQKYASIEAVSVKIKEILGYESNIFLGFKEDFKDIGFFSQKENIFVDNEGKYSKLYRSIYKGIYD